MKILHFVFVAVMLVCVASCGVKSNTDGASEAGEQTSVSDGTVENVTDYTDLLNTVYEKFVFATDADSSYAPEDYFTANALKKLRDAYEFDCEDGDCYAFYDLRTMQQESKPGSDEASRVNNVEPAADGWFVVSYSDMGWPGETRVKIVDGKIDDYERVEAD